MEQKLKNLSFIIIVFLIIACGDDWSASGDLSKEDLFRETFHYYYAENCSYDDFGPYDCEGAYAISPSKTIRLRVEYDGRATLKIDSDEFYFTSQMFEKYSNGDDYFQFIVDRIDIIVYTDGSEVIFIDSWAKKATFYYYDIFY